ncbi:hypothetical protein CRUP_027501 [Coryphaenoides rupestris]|nr:hypothetical protein CRUP_027501 [Coryphaenoides rupestris]
MSTPVDDVHLAPVAPSSEEMMLKGQKRKVPPAEEEEEAAAAAADAGSDAGAGSEAQRLLVLHVSLHKYQHGQELAEPSLRRAVLIANTLRRITCWEAASSSGSGSSSSSSSSGDEVAVVEDGDGGSSPLPPAPCEAADSAAPLSREIGTGLDVTISATTSATTTSNHQFHSSHSSAVSDLASPSQSHQNAVVSGRPHHQVNLHATPTTVSAPVDVCMETAGDSEDWESLSAAISSILTSLESSIDGGVGNQGLPAVTAAAAVTPRTPLRSLENLGAAEGEGGASKLGQQQGVKAPCWERAASADPSCVEVMRSSYLGDLALDDLFQDIDTSLLERELGVLGSRGEGGHPPTGEELLRYLPSLSSSSSVAPSSLSFLSSSSSPFLSFNQSLWCLPSISSFHPSTSPISTSSFFSFSSPSASSPSSAFPGQPLVRDGLELDHQMEVLVES